MSDTRISGNKNKPLMSKEELLELLKRYERNTYFFEIDTVQVKLLKQFVKSDSFKKLKNSDEVTLLDFITYLEKNNHDPARLFLEDCFKAKNAAGQLFYRFMYSSIPPFKTYQTTTSYIEYKKGRILQKGYGKGATGLLKWDDKKIFKMDHHHYHPYKGSFDILDCQSYQQIESWSGRGFAYALTCITQLSCSQLLVSHYDGMHSCGSVDIVHKSNILNWVDTRDVIKIGRAQGATAATALPDGRILLGLYDPEYRWGQLSIFDRINNREIILNSGQGKGATALAALPDGSILRGMHDCLTGWGETTILRLESMEETVLAAGYNEGATAFLILSENKILRAISNYLGNGDGELSIAMLNLNSEILNLLNDIFGNDTGNMIANYLCPTDYQTQKTIKLSQAKNALFSTTKEIVESSQDTTKESLHTDIKNCITARQRTC